MLLGILWSLMIACSISILFVSSAFFVVLGVLAISFFIAFIVSYNVASWYALIFVLIYVGGVLVLFFYVASLTFNPKSMVKDKYNNRGLLTFILVFFISFTLGFSVHTGNLVNSRNFSTSLFNSEEVTVVLLVACFLLIALWIVTKLTFRSGGSLRPVY